MSLKTTLNSCNEIYKTHLNEIAGVAITRRQAEVIACVVHNRGDKRIASILPKLGTKDSITPRTVGTHIRDILNKFGYNAREQIIDAVETSGKLHHVREFYLHLLVYSTFQQQLQKIGAFINRKSINCVVDFDPNFNDENKQQLFKADLDLANITLIKAGDVNKNKTDTEENKYYLYCLGTSQNIRNYNKTHNIALLFDQSMDNKLLQNMDYIDFREEENYYFSIFELVKKIVNKEELESIITEFKNFYDSINGSAKNFDPKILPSENITKKRNKKNLILKGLVIFCLLIVVVFTIFYHQYVFVGNQYKQVNNHKVENDTRILSSLRLPTKLLNRKYLYQMIANAFSTHNPIKIVALTGIGGAGKTTLARQYAKNSNASVVWEVHAEDKNSIINSFMNLARALAKTYDDKREIIAIQETKFASDREEKLGQFITDKIKNYSSWVLIYDNVQNIKDIEQYLPCDPDVWGKGKVVITSRNHNIANSIFIDHNCSIVIDELTLSEKEKMFDQVVPIQKNEETNKNVLIEKLPPFPLDIITAAHYIKTNNISYGDYISLLDKNDYADHDKIQQELIQDIGLYSHTRYNIIVSSVKEIISQNKDYQDLLLLTSMVDYKNIPKRLLVLYKGDVIVDKFINALRKYSLVTTMKTNNTDMGITFNMHPILQEIVFYYLQQNLVLNKDDPIIYKIVDVFEQYVSNVNNNLEQQEIKNSRDLLLHIEKLVEKSNLLNDDLKIKLGILAAKYYRLASEYNNAKNSLEKILSLIKHHKIHTYKTSYLLAELSLIYQDECNYDKSKDLLEQSINMTQSKFGQDAIELVSYFTRLGNIYFYLGNCKESERYLLKSLNIINRHYGTNHNNSLLALVYLGRLYVHTGEYNKAQEILENNIQTVQDQYGYQSYRVAAMKSSLGLLYMELGRMQEAKSLLEESVDIIISCIGKDHYVTAWYSAYLARCYQALGEINKAEDLLIKSYVITEKMFDAYHITMAGIKYDLGVLYLAKSISDNNNLKEAEKMLKEAYEIFNNSDHYKSYACLESLSDLYAKQGSISKSKHYLSESLKVAKKYLSSDSSHIKRLTDKITNMDVK